MIRTLQKESRKRTAFQTLLQAPSLALGSFAIVLPQVRRNVTAFKQRTSDRQFVASVALRPQQMLASISVLVIAVVCALLSRFPDLRSRGAGHERVRWSEGCAEEILRRTHSTDPSSELIRACILLNLLILDHHRDWVQTTTALADWRTEFSYEELRGLVEAVPSPMRETVSSLMSTSRAFPRQQLRHA
jgi:hypothetical protein